MFSTSSATAAATGHLAAAGQLQMAAFAHEHAAVVKHHPTQLFIIWYM